MKTLLFISALFISLTGRAQCGTFTIYGDTAVNILARTYDLSDTTHYNSIVISYVDTLYGSLHASCHLRAVGGNIYPFGFTFTDYDRQQYISQGITYLFCKVSMITALPIVP